MASNSQAIPSTREQFQKFAVGMFAGLCATIVPKMVTAIATSDPTGEIVLFGADYLILSVALSVILGCGVMILKWQDQLAPSGIFSTALGLPALVAGSLNVSASIHTVDRKTWEIDRLNSTIEREVGVVNYTTEPLELVPLDDNASRLDPSRSFAFSVVPSAHAQDGERIAQQRPLFEQRSFDPGQLIRERQYLIVLERSTDVAEARRALDRIRARVPSAALVRGGRWYYVVEGLRTRTRTAANLKALELKRVLPDAPVGLMARPSGG